jgi:hypothetical protein
MIVVVLGPEALDRCPGLDQRAVHAEVLAAHEVRGLLADGPKEHAGDLMVHQALPVAAEGARVERLFE